MLVQLILSPPAAAEGFLANGAILFADTTLYVDIYDDTSEALGWIGSGSVAVYDPYGAWLATLDTYEALLPESGPGTYTLVMSDDQTDWWQVYVTDITTGDEQVGRLHSYAWYFDTHGTDAGQWADLYVKVPLGDGSTSGLMLAQLDGMVGDLAFMATTTGLAGSPGMSALVDDDEPAASLLPLYLAEPALSAWTGSLTVGDIDFAPEGGLCEQVLSPGVVKGTFKLTADLDGVWQITCDTSGDGTFDLSGYTDLVVHHGEAERGGNEVSWGGLDRDGSAVSAQDSLACSVDFFQGAAHMLVAQASTAYEGVRMFARDPITLRYTPAANFWNDALIQAYGDTLPWSTGTAAVSSEPEGTSSGQITAAPIPNLNTHAWGDYSGVSKGRDAWVDTWSRIDHISAGEVRIDIVDPTLDTDADGLLDAEEDCLIGTDPERADTDEDGLPDGDEVDSLSSPIDRDDDGDIDALDPDDDGDAIATARELADGNAFGHDIDGDGLEHWHDTDSDGDGIDDIDEPDDSDLDGVPDYLQAAGAPDTGSPDSGSPDTGSPLQGTFRGGRCACGTGPAGGLLPALLSLLVLIRRRG